MPFCIVTYMYVYIFSGEAVVGRDLTLGAADSGPFDDGRAVDWRFCANLWRNLRSVKETGVHCSFILLVGRAL